ncbi:NOL1/NOP2/sun family putative RNA methylase [Nanoarchaeota archaeon]
MNFFLNRYKELGQEIKPEEIELRQSIRANTLKIKEKELIERLTKNKIKLEKIPWLKYGYFVEADFSIGATPEYLFGYYYIQEASAQFPVEILDPQSGETVLDMCAAPGGKTTQLSQMMQNKGVVVAIDADIKRLFALKNNIERTSCKNTVLYQKDARFVDDFEMKFDKILLDAPCSGNFSTDPEWFNKRDIEGIRNNASLQKELVRAALKCLKKNGVLVYATCSLEPEENEEVIEWALEKYGTEIKLEPIDVDIGTPGLTEKTKLCKRFWPNLTSTQGFFVAKIRKI